MIPRGEGAEALGAARDGATVGVFPAISMIIGRSGSTGPATLVIARFFGR